MSIFKNVRYMYYTYKNGHRNTTSHHLHNTRSVQPQYKNKRPVGRWNKTHKHGTKTINFFFDVYDRKGWSFSIFFINMKIRTFFFGLIKYIWYIYVIKYLKKEYENIIMGLQDDFSVKKFINLNFWPSNSIFEI